MSIIKILLRTVVMLICCVIQLIAITVNGISKLIGKIGDYLYALLNKIFELIDRMETNKTDVSVPR
jgi:hypothetical protein